MQVVVPAAGKEEKRFYSIGELLLRHCSSITSFPPSLMHSRLLFPRNFASTTSLTIRPIVAIRLDLLLLDQTEEYPNCRSGDTVGPVPMSRIAFGDIFYQRKRPSIAPHGRHEAHLLRVCCESAASQDHLASLPRQLYEHYEGLARCATSFCLLFVVQTYTSMPHRAIIKIHHYASFRILARRLDILGCLTSAKSRSMA